MDKEHFTVQLENAEPFTEENAKEFIQRRLDLNVMQSEKELTEYFYSKVGRKLLYFLVSNKAETKVEVLKIFDDELDNYDFKFFGMHGAIPRFTSDLGSIKKSMKDEMLAHEFVV
jgi:hypothetical protein